MRHLLLPLSRAAQARPPRMTPGTVDAAGSRPRGTRGAPGKASSTDYPWRPGASARRAFVASDRAAARLGHSASILPSLLSAALCALRLHFARQLRTRAARPTAFHFKSAPHPSGAAEGTGPVGHGPAPWWGSIDACELPFLFSPSEPPPALGKSPVPVARQPASLSRHKRPPEEMGGHLFHVRRNPGLSHPCHVPFTGLGPFG